MEKECIKYFKSNLGFDRLFNGLREKYRSLGSLGGVVKLNNLTQLEKDALSGLLRKDYYNKKHASIKVEQIYKALDSTRFQGVDLEAVVKGYFKGDLLSKKEERELYNLNKELFFEEIILEFKNTKASEWLKTLLENRSNAYRMISQNYDMDKSKLKEILILAMKGINILPLKSSEPIRLALFSSIVSKDPHAFDDGTMAGNILVYSIIYFNDYDYPLNAEERSEVLYSAGIIKDEISNYTTSNGLIAFKDGKIHEGWQGFYDRQEPMNISLWNLSKIEKVCSKSRIVFVFENPTVFSGILENTKDKNPSLICTYGQLKLASLVLMDKLVDNVDYIYYSGDFDPEGLQIADKLKTRFGEKLILWRFNISDYETIKSTKIIESQRIKKLDRIKSPELQAIAAHIKKTGYSAYQELLISRYIDDINRLINQI